MYITLITVYMVYGNLFLLLYIFYFIVNTGRKVEMILEFPRPPQATQQQQQEAGQPLIQLHSSYFYEGKVYNIHKDNVAVSRSVLRIRIRMFLGLLDLDPVVRGTDPDPFRIKQK